VQRGVARGPQPALVHFKLGCLFEDLHDWQAAANEYETALRLEPRAAKVHNNLGAVQQLMGHMDDALASFECALEIDPAFWLARYNIGLWMKMQGRFAEAVQPVQDALRMRRAIDAPHALGAPEETLTTHAKLRHDIEQLQYLLGRGLIDAEARDHVLRLEEALLAAGPDVHPAVQVEIPSGLRPRLARTYNRLHNFQDAPALPGGAVNPDLDHRQ
jgi:Tfp pilus assembly protein PilF